MLKKEKIKIKGMHCASCKTLLETELDIMYGINKVDVFLEAGSANIEFEDEKTSKKEFFKKIKELGYEPENYPETRSEEFPESDLGKVSKWVGLFLGIIFLLVIYIVLQKTGAFSLLAKLNEDEVGYGVIFVIGILASFHCVGMCGGLVVAYSAVGIKDKKTSIRPHFQYNFGRFISYTIIGAILGGIGSFFGINPIFTGIITFVAGFFMIMMGVSFLSEGRIFSRIKVKTPDAIARFLYNQKHSKNPQTPFVIGLLNGFMPCGPLQAVQLFALATGSVIQGATVMSLYALGTIPLMFGFGVAISKIGSSNIKNIMKISGVLVVLLGAIMMNKGFVSFGFGSISEEKVAVEENNKDFQEVRMQLTYAGYKPNVLYIEPEKAVRWVIDVKEMSGCTDAIMIESLGIKKDLKTGENIIEFIPPSGVSEIKFSCWMRMVWGKFVITEKK